MITFLTSAKAFRGTTGENQERAIQSWRAMHRDVDVFLYGESFGAEQVCRRLRITYVPEIACASSGAPYFDALVAHAAEHARHEIHAYVNCDILLNGSLLAVVHKMDQKKFLLVGQRIDLAESSQINMSANGWRRHLSAFAGEGKAQLHSPSGMDYFVFPRGMWGDLNPLIVGRAGYDTGLVAFCLQHKIPVIDCTLAVTALHQFHAYEHMQNGAQEVFFGSEAEQNRSHHKIRHSGPNTADAGWMVRDSLVLKSRCRGDLLREWELCLRFGLNLGPAWMAIRSVWRFLVSMGWYTSREFALDEVLRAQESFESASSTSNHG